jgi:hypothetical protein
MQINRQIDLAKLIVAFRNFVKAPNKCILFRRPILVFRIILKINSDNFTKMFLSDESTMRSLQIRI